MLNGPDGALPAIITAFSSVNLTDHHPPPTTPTIQELKAGKAYTTLRVARNDAKLAGIRKGKAGKGGDDKDE